MNSVRKTYAGRTREADHAMIGAVLKGWDPAWDQGVCSDEPARCSKAPRTSAATSYYMSSPEQLADEFRKCRERTGKGKDGWKTGCSVYAAHWFGYEGTRI